MEKNMLGITLREVSGPLDDLNKKLCSEEGKKWLEAFKLFLRGKPTWAEEMIYPSLEWASEHGSVSEDRIQDHIRFYCRDFGEGWRLPTANELRRALRKMKPDGFRLWKYYWSSTKGFNGRGNEVLRTHDGTGGLGSSSSLDHLGEQRNPHLRLCRPIKLPE